MKIKNIDKGPRGVNTTSGPVLIEAGQEVDVELSDAERKVAAKTGWFDLKGAAARGKAPEPPQPPADLDAMTDDELRAFIEKRDGKAPHHASKRETLLAKARGEDDED